MTQLDETQAASVADRAHYPTAYRRPALPPAVYEIDPDIDARVDRIIQQYGLSEKTARELLRDWCERAPFARSDIAFASVPLRVVSSVAIHIEQLLQVERRTLTSTTEAYRGLTGADEDDTEDIWETQRFGKFKTGSVTWQRRGGVEVTRCYECHGRGKLPCGRCSEHGKITSKCRACRGAGTTSDSAPCATCEGTGKTRATCKACRGKGFNQCPTCDGSGRLRTSQFIKATATTRRRSVVIGSPPTVEKSWIKGASAEDVEWFEGENDVLAGYVGRPLPKDARVRVAQYGVRVVPVSWATVFVGKEFKVYFVGTGHDLKRVGPLLDKRRILVNVSILVPLFVALLFVARLLLFS